MKSRNVRLFALLALLGSAACEDALTPGDLSETEAAEMAGAIVASTFSTMAGMGGEAPANGPARVPVSYSQSIDVTPQCPLGGEVRIEASSDYTGDTQEPGFELNFEARQEHNDCGVAGESGREFVLNGAPALEVELGIVSEDGESASWTGSFDGAVNWESEGFEGTCEVMLDFSGNVAGAGEMGQGSASFFMGGTVCGHAVEQQLSIGGTGSVG